jgi:hypothetical protein
MSLRTGALTKIFGFNPLARKLITGGFSGNSRYKLEDLIFHENA